MRADFPSRAHHRCRGAVKGLSFSRAPGFWIRPGCFKLRFLFHIAQNLFSDHGSLIKSKRGMRPREAVLSLPQFCVWARVPVQVLKGT